MRPTPPDRIDPKTLKQVLDMFDETEAFWVPAGYLDEPYNVDLQKVLRHLRDNGTIFLAAVDNGFEEWKKL